MNLEVLPHRRFRRVASLAAAATTLLLVACSLATAQDYEELPLFQVNGKPVQAWSNLHIPPVGDKTDAITQMLTGAGVLVPADFDQYFNEIVFPLFTQWREVKGSGGKTTSPLVEGFGGVNPPNMRARFKRDYASKATNISAHERLNNLTLTKMDQIATGNFHPVVRANAVMMIADLNDSDPNGPPWKKALPMLLSYIKSKDTIDAVRVPAWRGLVRQAQSGIDADSRAEVIKAVTQTLGERDNVQGRGQDGQDWICRRAIDVLVALNDPDANGAISKSLLDTLNDGSASLTIRAAAAEALAKVKFNPPPNFNASALAKTLGKLAVEDYKNELDKDAKHNPMIVDRLKQHLGQIRLGLVGSDGNGGVHAMSAVPDTQQYVNSLIAPIDNLVAACDTPLLPPPVATTAGYGGASVVVPIDRQKNIAEAIANAGSSLEAAVQRGEAGAPGAVPGGATPDKSPQNNNPLGLKSVLDRATASS